MLCRVEDIDLRDGGPSNRVLYAIGVLRISTHTALGSGLETGSQRRIAVKFDCSHIFSLRSFLELIVVNFQRVEQREYVRPPASFRVCGSGTHEVKLQP